LAGINEFIVKVASRCNINCDYCYEYNLGDESWRLQPKFMSVETIRALARRIREHSATHNIRSVWVTFHGGEPLMLGAKRLDQLCCALIEEISGSVDIQFGMQTNAMLISKEVIDVIRRRGIQVSVSVDGGRDANDRHRRDHKGLGTYSRAANGIKLLQEHAPELLTGVLAVIDVKNDPVEALDAIASWGVEWVDFLLPHHHWDNPPPRPAGDEIVYGKWYWDLYTAWVADRHPKITVRFLANIVGQLAGGRSIYEAMSLAAVTLIVIAADGSIEGVDSLKSTASGAQNLNLNVHRNSIDDAISVETVKLRQTGVDQLCDQCKQCAFVKSCAGGYLPHRWSRETAFGNPSVYCKDLFWLLSRIKEHLHVDACKTLRAPTLPGATSMACPPKLA
jgi:uncharacterized protein